MASKFSWSGRRLTVVSGGGSPRMPTKELAVLEGAQVRSGPRPVDSEDLGGGEQGGWGDRK